MSHCLLHAHRGITNTRALTSPTTLTAASVHTKCILLALPAPSPPPLCSYCLDPEGALLLSNKSLCPSEAEAAYASWPLNLAQFQAALALLSQAQAAKLESQAQAAQLGSQAQHTTPLMFPLLVEGVLMNHLHFKRLPSQSQLHSCLTIPIRNTHAPVTPDISSTSALSHNIVTASAAGTLEPHPRHTLASTHIATLQAPQAALASSVSGDPGGSQADGTALAQLTLQVDAFHALLGASMPGDRATSGTEGNSMATTASSSPGAGADTHAGRPSDQQQGDHGIPWLDSHRLPWQLQGPLLHRYGACMPAPTLVRVLSRCLAAMDEHCGSGGASAAEAQVQLACVLEIMHGRLQDEAAALMDGSQHHPGSRSRSHPPPSQSQPQPRSPMRSQHKVTNEPTPTSGTRNSRGSKGRSTPTHSDTHELGLVVFDACTDVLAFAFACHLASTLLPPMDEEMMRQLARCTRAALRLAGLQGDGGVCERWLHSHWAPLDELFSTQVGEQCADRWQAGWCIALASCCALFKQ